MAHAPASRQNVMRGTGLSAVRSAGKPPESRTDAEKQFQVEGKNEMESALERARQADKLGEVMDHAPYATEQCPTQVWGAVAVAEKQYRFSRWYFMAPNRAIVDMFMTQEKYDEAEVEARRALVHRYGMRYAALGPNHSRRPIEDKDKAKQKALREKFPSLVEQLAAKVG